MGKMQWILVYMAFMSVASILIGMLYGPWFLIILGGIVVIITIIGCYHEIRAWYEVRKKWSNH